MSRASQAPDRVDAMAGQSAASICHVTTVHPAMDSRIYLRECVSLADAGYSVHLVAPGRPGQPAITHPGICVHLVNQPRSRLLRMLLGPWNALRAARRTGACLWHLHDPELLPLAVLLSTMSSARVVYDAHENLPQDIAAKSWLPAALRPLIARAAAMAEHVLSSRIDAVVAATETIADRLRRANACTRVVRNFPRAASAQVPPTTDVFAVYAGLLSRRRGLFQMLEACHREAMPLRLVGHFVDEATEREARSHPGWRNVDHVGRVAPDEVFPRLVGASAGLCLLEPDAAHDDALPTKVFEYMQAGVPVIASGLRLTRAIVDKHGCGICVDYADVDALQAALATLRNDPLQRQRMGDAGRVAALTDYRWEDEADVLKALYVSLGVTPRAS